MQSVIKTKARLHNGNSEKHAANSSYDLWTLKESFWSREYFSTGRFQCPRFGQRKSLKIEENLEIWEMKRLPLKGELNFIVKKKKSFGFVNSSEAVILI